MEAKAQLRKFNTSPRKMRLLIDLIRGMNANEAYTQLEFSKKWGAKPLQKLLKSAVFNATHNHQMDDKTLMIKEAFVDNGPILYRFQPRAFGRAFKIRKRSSHITIILTGEVNKTTPEVESVKEVMVEGEMKEEKKTKKTTVKKVAKKANS
jgi:large subunit ribosomal protein L22